MRLWLIPLSILALSAPIASAQANSLRKPVTDAAQSSRIARGHYIVEDLVQCARCHTPVDENGHPYRDQWLMGGPVQTRPTYNSPNWALRAPRIAGRPPGTDADFIRLMTTGIARTGEPPNPPMLQFHMTKDDAEAVLAYLKSLAH